MNEVDTAGIAPMTSVRPEHPHPLFVALIEVANKRNPEKTIKKAVKE